VRILAVTPYYEPEGGGLERYAHEILRRLARQGHQVRVLCFTRQSARVDEVEGVPVDRVDTMVRFGNTPIHPGFSRRVAEAIDEHAPDVVVAHTPVPFPAEMAYRAAAKAKVPFVATYHAGSLRGSNRVLGVAAAVDRGTLERRMLAGAAGLIAVGPYVRDHALARHRERVVIVPPGVDTGFFRPSGDADPAHVLFVGPVDSSYRWKGLDILWDALVRVRKTKRQTRLTIIGTGDRMGEFERKADALEGAVALRGRVSQDELRKAYQTATCLVLPSTTDAESFGMVLAEANACGRPVVGSRVGGIPDFVSDADNGLLAHAGDAADLAAKILQVLGDADAADAMGRRGRQRVERDHRWDGLADRTLAAYSDAVKRHVLSA
jgi:glycosyltransferase involved in cell wall biosynthesis